MTSSISTWFITGASRGMGRDLTEALLADGRQVVATARRSSDLDALHREYPGLLHPVTLDVTDTSAVRATVAAAFADLGRIDVVVSNAGSGIFGTVEDVSDDHVEQMIAVNLVGSMQIARAAIAPLRQQGGGLLVQMSSMGGTSRSRPSRCTTPPSGASRASTTHWPRRWLPSASAPCSSNPAS